MFFKNKFNKIDNNIITKKIYILITLFLFYNCLYYVFRYGILMIYMFSNIYVVFLDNKIIDKHIKTVFVNGKFDVNGFYNIVYNLKNSFYKVFINNIDVKINKVS